MASVQTSTFDGRYLKLTVTATAGSSSENYSTINWKVESIGGNSNYYTIYSYGVYIDGAWRDDDGQGYIGWTSKVFPAAKGSRSGSFTVQHNDDGTPPRTISFALHGRVHNSGDDNRTGSITLSTIPRYFSSTPTLTCTSRTETTATFKWTTPQKCSRVQYKIDSGGWVDVVSDANATSGTYTISGLSANKTYTISGDFMRRDSGLWAQTKPSTRITTYAYPYLTSVPEFTVGNTLTIGIYNPLGRSCVVSIIGDNGNEITGGTITGTSISGFNNDGWKNNWYNSLTTKTQGTYKARLKCSTGNINQLSGAVKYYLNTSDTGFKPTFDTGNVINIVNTAHTDIAGSNKFIKNHNSLSGVITSMNPQRYAEGDYYNISSSGLPTVQKDHTGSNISFVLGNMSTNSFNVTAVDSRGFTSSANKTIDLVNYNNPGVTTARITRQNGIGTKAILAFTGVYTNWSGLLKTNAIQSIRYKIGSGGSLKALPSSAKLINSNGGWTLNATLDDTFAVTSQYDLYLEVKDLLETVVLGPFTISTADAFIWKDLANKRVGVNKKPDCALDVAGDIKGSNNITGVNIKGNTLYINGVKTLWYE